MKTKILSAIAISAMALSASAQNYKVVVTATDGTKTAYETTSLQSIKFQEAPAYLNTPYLAGAEYVTKNTLGNYYVAFASAEPDANGNPASAGDILLGFELTAAESDDPYNAILPAGFYQAGTGAAIGEFNYQRAAIAIRTGQGDEDVTFSPITDGTVLVQNEGGNYDIRCEMKLLTGESVAARYEGPINFVVGSTENAPFTEDQNVTFTGVQERYYANWYYPFCDDAFVEFYTGSFTEDGVQKEGYWLHLDTFMPLAEDPAHPTTYLPDGIYTIDPREEVANYTNLPFTIGIGREIDFWGQTLIGGSYIKYTAANGTITQSMITGGTMTVSNNSTKMEFDFETPEGIHITGTYEGNLLVKNFSEPGTAPAIEGTLTGDVALDFSKGQVALSYNSGDYIKAGLNQFTLMVTDTNMKVGDYLGLELISDQRSLADGTYTINNEIANYGGLKGFCDYGGNVLYSWYGDLSSTDDEGYQTVLAPIMGGTVTVTTIDADNKKIEFNLVDEDGHKLTGTYQGRFFNYDATAEAPAKVKNRATKHVKAPAAKAPEQPRKL